MNIIKKSRSELKREAILLAAKKAFIEDGVKGTSMDKISELAQVSKRTVYNHFASKEVLVMHIMNDLWRQAMVQIDLHYQPNKLLQAQLEQLLLAEAKLLCSQDYLNISRVAFGHFFYRPALLKEEMLKYSTQETALYRWLQEATQDNKLALQDISFANNQLHSLIKGSCFWPQLLQIQPILKEEELNNIASQTAALFLGYNEIK